MRVWIASMLWLLAVTAAGAQDPSVLQGDWSGTLQIGPQKLRLELSITQSTDGLLFGSIVSVDQGGVEIAIASVVQTAMHLELELPTVGGKFSGDLKDGKLVGTWSQGPGSLPLEFSRPVP